jgi:PPP family 3-phenylpropionic acid transporter
VTCLKKGPAQLGMETASPPATSSATPPGANAAARPLAVFYVCAFISVGIATPYLSPYLSDLGLSGSQIATVLSLTPICYLGVPLLWGWIADRTHRHDRVLRVAAFGAALGIALLSRAHGFRGALPAYALFAAFYVGIGPVVDTLAVASSPQGRGYGRLRMWGSFGFLVAAALGGVVLAVRGSRPADPAVPLMMLAGLCAAGATSFAIPTNSAAHRAKPRLAEVSAVWRDRRFRLLLLVAALHWMAMAPYNVFFGLLLRNRHLSPAIGGAAFAVGVIAEGAIMFWFAELRRAFRLETLLCVAFAATVARWALVSWVTGAFWMVALQALHGLTFGLFWVTGISLLNEIVPPTVRATGQALYLAAMLGLGSLAGYHATGLILDTFHDVGPAFLAAGAAELAPFAIVWQVRRRLPGR